ncbi:ABC transporter substrate-binding protein [Treponema primitia]|uniref:ABC transporter substrate-binding protein n=1 Tax=Treponema primitia TaxID=88058 RepID=UPI00397FF871
MKKSAVIFVSLCLAALAFTGCKKTNSAAGSGDIIIGGIFPLSGGVAVYGTEAQKGILLAIEEINAGGGVGGRKLVLISEDDEGDAAKSVNAFRKLTAQNKAKIIIGSLTSGCTIAISSLAQTQGVLLMAPAASAVAVTDAGGYVFRACFIDPFQGTVAGVFAFREINAKKAAVLYDNGNDYSVGLQENFVKAFSSLGGTVVASEVYNGGDVDFNAQLTRIKASNPDMIYLPDYYSTVALIAKQLRAQGISVPIMGADGWDGLQENAGDEVLNGFFTNNFTPDSTDPKVAGFVKAFQGKYGALPASFAALGYDSLYLIRDAIVSAATAEPAAVKDALANINSSYVTGSIRFDDKRNPIKPAVVLELVKGPNGKLTSAYKTTVNP